MAESPQPGSRSPLRVGGIALLGVGVIAAFAGLITTTQGNGNGTVAQAPTASAGVLESAAPAAAPTEPAVASPPPDAARVAPAPATPFVPGATGDGTAVGAAPPASAVPAPAPAPVEPAPPAVAAPAPAPAPGGSSSVPHGPLRVYNNSLIQGLAARAAADFRSRRLDGRRDRRLPGRDHPDEHRLLPPGHGRADRGAGDRPGLRAAGRAALRRDPVRQPRGDRHRDQGVPVAGQVVSLVHLPRTCGRRRPPAPVAGRGPVTGARPRAPRRAARRSPPSPPATRASR